MWDATCVDTLALSHRVLTVSGSVAVADDAGTLLQSWVWFWSEGVH